MVLVERDPADPRHSVSLWNAERIDENTTGQFPDEARCRRRKMPGHESENDHEELKRHSSPRLPVQDMAEPRQKNSCEQYEIGIERPP